jgi:hypothetical protein
VRCPRCGNENPATNRFCGTCGASLVSVPPPGARSESATQTTSVRNSAAATSAAPISANRTVPPVAGDVPAITGPSFLGLNAPPAPSRSRNDPNLQRGTQHGPPSGNLDYLLDDEEEPSGVAGKVFLILIALALALGFGYLRWRHEGLSSLWSSLNKPSTAKTEQAPSSTTEAPANAPDASSPAPGAAGSNPGQPTGTTSQPAASPDASSSSTSAPAATAGSPDTSAPNTAGDHPADAASPSAAASAPPTDKPAKDDSGSAAAPASSEESSEPAPAPKPATKPRLTPKPTAAKEFDQVTEAEKYIYGRGGARQDCDRGMRMLRPAAEQLNPRAMISLGALYSTGVCAPRDLPTAYRWFALALRKQPDNQPLQENLQRLWAQMTQPERQLAVKLSQ